LNNPTSTKAVFTISDVECIKQKVLKWAKLFSTFCLLDNHQYQTNHHSIECVLAAGVKRKFESDNLSGLQSFIDEKEGWLFGHLSYDLKNSIEAGLESGHTDNIGFATLSFFEPIYLLHLTATELSIEGPQPQKVWEAIEQMECHPTTPSAPMEIKARLQKEEYISIIEKLQQHIRRGDCYEINFCQEFYAENALLDPITIYQQLSAVSPNPFSALYRQNDSWLICASPERFLRKEGNTILSQPIKGTAKRIPKDTLKDAANKELLQHSEKDKSENVMVVDLVRNDLSKICEEGTVMVDELFGVYTFPQVYQMISTISGKLLPSTTFIDIIKATFPMGSMTGAPKRRVMQLIEQYENSRRGIFAGAVGYISPSGDMDFNVVIRSIMYNAASCYVSFQAGSGITFYSDAVKEWEECLLKAEAIKKVLTGDGIT
jgi:para-aminobenzoate synthetase component I